VRARPRKLDHILFPTDFGEASERAFPAVISLARELGARITFFHALPKLIEPVLASGAFLLAGVWVPGEEYLRSQKRAMEEMARAWADRAAMQDVKAAWIVDSGRGPVSERIAARARALEAGMIALAAQSGAVVSAILGSVTREVVRSAPCPVWVLRAPEERGAQRSRPEAS
jgi:nucleotide-binding universal stress UspA family protein